MYRSRPLKHTTLCWSIRSWKLTRRYLFAMLTCLHNHTCIKFTHKISPVGNYLIWCYCTGLQEARWVTSAHFTVSLSISMSMRWTTLEMDSLRGLLTKSTETSSKFSTCMWIQSKNGENRQAFKTWFWLDTVLEDILRPYTGWNTSPL